LKIQFPPAPQKPFQKAVKACKINDLQAFLFLDIFKIYQSIGAEPVLKPTSF